MNNRYIDDIDPHYRIVKLNDGTLTFRYDKYDTTNDARNVLALNSRLKDKNIPLLYIQAPFKVDEDNSQMPKGVVDYSNQNTNHFLKLIQQDNNIEVLDLRTYFKEKGLAGKDVFYNTDHHWKTESGFLAFQKVISVLKDQYDFKIDSNITKKDNYDFTIYKNVFLGSEGKRVGKYYGGIDDFTIITPKFDTDFLLYVPNYNILKSGNFNDSLLDLSKVDKPNLYDTNTYTAYLQEDWNEFVIYNKLTKNENKVLLVKDSFNLVVTPFLASGLKELHVIDLRYSPEKTLKDKIEEVNPDVVMFLYNPSAYRKDMEKMFMFE